MKICNLYYKNSRLKTLPSNATAVLIMMLASTTLYTSPAYAGSETNATITAITAFEGKNALGQDGFVLVWTNLVNSGKPACAPGAWQNTYAVNPGTTGGAAIMASLLAAQAQGASVSLVGTGACALGGSAEDLAYVSVNTP